MAGVDHGLGQVGGACSAEFGQEHLVQTLPHALLAPANAQPASSSTEVCAAFLLPAVQR
jgi:hypothetical protein